MEIFSVKIKFNAVGASRHFSASEFLLDSRQNILRLIASRIELLLIIALVEYSLAAERFKLATNGIAGKRLTYRALTGKEPSVAAG